MAKYGINKMSLFCKNIRFQKMRNIFEIHQKIFFKEFKWKSLFWGAMTFGLKVRVRRTWQEIMCILTKHLHLAPAAATMNVTFTSCANFIFISPRKTILTHLMSHMVVGSRPTQKMYFHKVVVYFCKCVKPEWAATKNTVDQFL